MFSKVLLVPVALLAMSVVLKDLYVSWKNHELDYNYVVFGVLILVFSAAVVKFILFDLPNQSTP